MITIEDIKTELADLDKLLFDVHTIDEAWYSSRSLFRAVGSEKCLEYPKVEVVRVSLITKSGMLELHIREDDLIEIFCYCCWERDDRFKKGLYPLNELKAAVLSFTNHHCPYFPG